MMNVKAKTNFDKNVDIVDSQISLLLELFSDSTAMCIPKASERASAIAIIKIPAIIIFVELELEFNPIIKPKVVIMPDVIPKPKPFITEALIYLLQRKLI